MDSTHVTLPYGFLIKKTFLKHMYENISILEKQEWLMFWSLVYWARHPTVVIEDSVMNELIKRDLLSSTANLNYIHQMAVLYLVEGRDRKIKPITSEKFEKLISGNTP